MPMEHLGSAAKTRTWRRAFVVTTVVGLLLVFWLPTRFPPPPAYSESYLFGFNNHVCELLFGALIVGLGLIAKLGGLRFPRVGGRSAAEAIDVAERTNSAGGLTVRLLGICLAIDTVLCGIVYWIAHGLGGLNDGAYYLDRIQLIARGEVPYRDFEFLYGSTPLYTALGLGRLLHTSAENGYYLIWGFGSVVGILLLWQSIRWLELPGEGKRRVFLLYYVLLSIMIPLATLNYYSLRYTLPLFAVTGLHRLDRDARSSTRAGVILFAVVMTALLLGISPEEGIVYTVAVCLYLPLRRYYARRPFLVDMLVLLAALAGVVAIVARAGTFKSMSSFSAGAWNLPIYPGPPILAAFAAVICMVFYLATRTPAQWARSNVTFAVIYGLGMLPGALGRCDDTHVSGYLLSILVCAMLLSRLWLPMWRVATIGFALVFIALPYIATQHWRPPVLRKAFFFHVYGEGGPHSAADKVVDEVLSRGLVLALGRQRGEAKLATMRAYYSLKGWEPRTVFPGISPIVSAPFEYSPKHLGIYQAPEIDEGYYMGTLNIMTGRDVQRKIDEVKAHPEEDLIVPQEYCQPWGDIRSFMKELLFMPWVPAQKHQMTTMDPYCAYVHAHYQVLYPASDATFGYIALRRKPGQ